MVWLPNDQQHITSGYCWTINNSIWPKKRQQFFIICIISIESVKTMSIEKESTVVPGKIQFNLRSENKEEGSGSGIVVSRNL